MILRYTILIICLLATKWSEISADIDEFCTLSGNIRNLDEKSFSGVSVKL